MRGGADAIRLAERDFPAARTHEALTVKTSRAVRDAVARQGIPAIAPRNLLATECVRGASTVDRHPKHQALYVEHVQTRPELRFESSLA